MSLSTDDRHSNEGHKRKTKRRAGGKKSSGTIRPYSRHGNTPKQRAISATQNSYTIESPSSANPSGSRQSADPSEEHVRRSRTTGQARCCTNGGQKSAGNVERMREAVKTLLECIGEDPDREGLRKTPLRYAKALVGLTDGYRTSIDDLVNDALFCESSNEMIIVTSG